MQNFEWVTPTKVIFGSKILDRLGSETGRIGKRALFLYGKESIKKAGCTIRWSANCKVRVFSLWNMEACNPIR